MMNRETIYLGVDPGKSGGMAGLFKDGRVVAMTSWKGEAETIEFLDTLKSDYDTPFDSVCFEAVIERVGGFVRGTPAPGSAMFRFGENFGWLRGYFAGRRIPYCTVKPEVWQKGLGAVGEKSARKRSLKDIALQRFPESKVTLKTCDALLLADWLRRQSVRESA